MNFTVSDYLKQLKEAKKEYDKLCKEYKKTKNNSLKEYLREDIEDLRQDIIQIQISMNELKQGKPLHLCDTSQFDY